MNRKNLEGYLCIDHRNSPGVPEEITHAQGLPAEAGSADTIFETAVATCGHCEAQVYLNSNRTRERYFCSSCNHYICDSCKADQVSGKACYPFKAMVGDLLEKIDKGRESEVFQSILLP